MTLLWDQVQNVFRKTASAEFQRKQFPLLHKYFFSCYIFTLLLLSFFKESQFAGKVIYSTRWFILFRGFAIAFCHETYLLLHTVSTYPMNSLCYPPGNLGISGTVLLASWYKYLKGAY